MDTTPESNSEQAALWNGVAGRAWVDEQALLDGMLEPFRELLVAEVAAVSARRVLDVGCGAGDTTLAVARLLGEAGRCTGIDISAPLVDAARLRAQREGVAADFVCADAQEHAFEPGSFDMVISRFGVMFFDDPVRAFTNLERAAAAGAALRFIAWRSAAENPFMTTAERAAAPLLPNLPPRPPDGPGQFAFADESRVRRILEESGWAAIDVRPLDVTCTLPASELVRYVTRLGPVGSVFPELDEPTRAPVVETVRAAFEPYVHGEVVRTTAACWMVSASA
ncbi:MAG TPA: methyltransferase domain-containing protein [Thermoanaerobaculia bacterium]|nr:methyltransferase domain-containing protein [Thermoanaerobaculia bacterium]